MTPRAEEPDLDRRTVLRTAAVGGLGLPLLAACGSGTESGDRGSTDGSGDATGDAGSGSDSSGGLVAAADVPVGGGVILTGAKVVVTQPTEGDFKAFSAVCTHQGCVVNKVTDGKIVCPCHGSEFSIEDGSVVAGPAPKPLSSVSVSQQGDEIVEG